MKKVVLFAAASLVAFAFTSCKKYEVSEPLDLAALPTVTIKGDLYAQLDETNGGLENAPKGLKVTVSVPLIDYNPDNTSGGNHIITTKTDANGKFSIKVPVVSSGVKAVISFESFTASVIKSVGQTAIEEKTSLFELADQTKNNLGTGNSQELMDLGNLTYLATSTDPNAGTFTPTSSITVEGILTYPIKRKVGNPAPDTTIYAPIPEGTVLVVKISSKDEFGTKEFKQTINVVTTAGGKYLVEVPMVQNGTASIEVKGSEILAYEDLIASPNVNALYNMKLSFTETLSFVDYIEKDHKYTLGTKVKDID